MNRGFLYGDGFFETIRVVNGQIPLIFNHLDRIDEALSIYHLAPQFDISEDLVRGIASSYEDNGLLRINFFRDGGGKYMPETDDVAFDHSFTATESPFFLPITLDLESELKKAPVQKGTFGVYPEPKPNVQWMTVKSLSSIYYVLAAKYKEQHSIDYLFIHNDKGEICEELVSNIILQIGDKFIIPTRESGGVNGATQRYILGNYGFQIEERVVTIDDIENAEVVYSCKGSAGVSRIL